MSFFFLTISIEQSRLNTSQCTQINMSYVNNRNVFIKLCMYVNLKELTYSAVF